MEQTRQSVKSTFGNGLIMDFAPDTAPNQSLSNALNATFVTFNGNEGLLQNDMGNARVESAYLPEGYIPVGTCEFGDIIYVVSYNPLKNKSQIGCFPSPERNLSSSEISNLEQQISSSEFIKIVDDTILGKVTNSRAKHVIYQDKLHAGDKYIISWGTESVQNYNTISNIGNSSESLVNTESYWPKLIKVHVVSIEDSGKIIYLDNDVKWYPQKESPKRVTYKVFGEIWGTRQKTSKEIFNGSAVQIPENSELLGAQVTKDNFTETITTNSLFYIDPNNYLILIDSQLTTWYVSKKGNIIKFLESSEDCEKCDLIQESIDAKFIISTEILENTNSSTNLDNYRHALSSNYSVFQSRTPGKLALLFELEKITGFSCGHKTFKVSEKEYDIYLSFSWETDNYNINPCGVIITDAVTTNVTATDNNLIPTEDTAYNASRVVDISRVYQQENPPTGYEDFLAGSFYQEKYQNPKDDSGNVATTILRAYKDQKPQEFYNKGGYYINAASITKDSAGNRIYTNSNGGTCEITYLTDDVVVNTYKKSVLKYLGRVSLTEKDGEKNLYQYTVCPCMPYGVLEEFAITNIIDFNKAQTGEVKLNTWQYYVNSTSMYLTFGFDTFLKEDENEVIDFIEFEFYDNNGLATVYHLSGQESYDSKFTEYFNLDSSLNNGKFLTTYLPEGITDRSARQPIYHTKEQDPLTYADIKDNAEGSYIFRDASGNWASVTSSLQDDSIVYQNDAGILYYGRPYAVKIKIYKGIQDELGNINSESYLTPITECRWMWTAPLFNDSYGIVLDFNTCQFEPTLDYYCEFDGTNIQEKSIEYTPELQQSTEPTSPSKTYLGAQVLKVHADTLPNKGLLQLSNTYGDSIYLLQDNKTLGTFNIQITINNSRIENSSTNIAVEFETSNSSASVPELLPITGNIDYTKWSKTLLKLLGITDVTSTAQELWEDDSYKNYCDYFKLTLPEQQLRERDIPLTYLDADGNLQSTKSSYLELTGQSWRNDGFNFTFDGIRFSKLSANRCKTSNQYKVLCPVIESKLDLASYGIDVAQKKDLSIQEENAFYFEQVKYIGVSESKGEDGFISSGIINYAQGYYPKLSDFTEIRKGDWAKFFTQSEEGQNLILGSPNTSPFVACFYGWGQQKENCHEWTALEGVGKIYLQTLLTSQGYADIDTKNYHIMPKTTARVGHDNNAENQPYTVQWGNRSESGNAIVSLGLIDSETQSIYLLSDWFVSAIHCKDSVTWSTDTTGESIQGQDSDSNTSWMDLQQFYNKEDQSAYPGHSLAHLIASILCQMYVVKTQNSLVYLPNDLVKLSDNTEEWKADLVITMVPTQTEYTNVNFPEDSDQKQYKPSSACFGLKWPYGTTYRIASLIDYLRGTLSYFGYNKYASQYYHSNRGLFYDEASEDDPESTWIDWEYTGPEDFLLNVNPKLTTTTKATEFCYSVPYDVSNLEAMYTDISMGIPYKIGNNKGTTQASIQDTKIYINTGTEDSPVFTEFNERNAKFKMLTSFLNTEDTTSMQLQYGKVELKLNPSSNLSEVLYWDGNKINCHNLSKLSQANSTCYLYFAAKGDDCRILDIRKSHIFNYFYDE